MRDTFLSERKAARGGNRICHCPRLINISHATFGHFRGHQQSLNGVDVEVVIDGVGRRLTVGIGFGRVERIRVVASAHRRHFDVSGLWCRGDNHRVGGVRGRTAGGIFESCALCNKLIVLKARSVIQMKYVWNFVELT